MTIWSAGPLAGHKPMITLLTGNINKISQEIYNSFISGLQIYRLTCPSCGLSGGFTVHGYYNRSIRTEDGLVTLRIIRLKCRCGKTHAVLLSSMIPWSQLSLSDTVLILESGHNSENYIFLQLSIPDISISLIRSIRIRFHRFFEQRLLSEKIPLSPGDGLVKSCFRFFSRQFMQIRWGPNILYEAPT